MKRVEAFHSLKEHAWHKRSYAKLSQAQVAFCDEFIQQNDQLSTDDFEYEVNRMFLDKEKPKHHTIILELLTCANSVQARKS